ncbi:MAG: GDSL-type esterase/lipase family protein [Primorskyibacter sp.]
MAVIVCYGDSNTHGTQPMTAAGVSHRHPVPDRWPEAMAQALGPAHTVLSEGLPGRTTVHEDVVEGGARNGLAVLPAILHSHKPIDLLIVMLGTNDLKPHFGVSGFEVARSVERILRAARAEGVHARDLIVAPAPVREAGCLAPVFAGAETRQRGMGEHMGRVAGALGSGFVDAGNHVTVSPDDGVHWDGAAHRQFGLVMAKAVRTALA